MSTNPTKFLITHSLLSSWSWVFKTETGYDDFIRTLNRIPTPMTQAILEGNQFETMVSRFNEGFEPDPGHKWYKGIKETAAIVKGSAEQVKLSKVKTVNGVDFLLYGILDNLRAGIIRDTKMSKGYSYGKYKDSTQHPMYFELCPEAYKFEYVVFNGKDVYTEPYYKYDTEPIDKIIAQFMEWLDRHGLVDLYADKWMSKW